MKTLKYIIIFSLYFFLISCNGNSGIREYSPPRFNFTPYKFDVSNIVIETDKNHIDPLDQYSKTLQDSLEIWIKDRIYAAGETKTLKIIVKEAKIRNLSAEKFTGLLNITFEIYDEDILFPVSESNFQVSQNIIIANSSTLYERQSAIYELITKLIKDFDQQVEENIKEYFGRHLL